MPRWPRRRCCAIASWPCRRAREKTLSSRLCSSLRLRSRDLRPCRLSSRPTRCIAADKRQQFVANTPFSAAADAAWAKDPDWIVPNLWRSEFRNALAGSIRQRSLTVEEASAIENLGETILDRKEFTVST